MPLEGSCFHWRQTRADSTIFRLPRFAIARRRRQVMTLSVIRGWPRVAENSGVSRAITPHGPAPSHFNWKWPELITVVKNSGITFTFPTGHKDDCASLAIPCRIFAMFPGPSPNCPAQPLASRPSAHQPSKLGRGLGHPLERGPSMPLVPQASQGPPRRWLIQRSIPLDQLLGEQSCRKSLREDPTPFNLPAA